MPLPRMRQYPAAHCSHRRSLLECRLHSPEAAVIPMCNASRRRFWLAPLLACLCLAQAPVSMADEEPPKFEYVEPAPWKEQGVELPAYPDGGHFVAVPLQLAGSNLEMFVDEPSLSIGDDGVVRYVLMLRSPTGTENLFYEGIRCSSQEWRSYAYGSSAGKWQALGETPWRVIGGLGTDRYRLELYQYYLCDPKVGPRLRKEMFRRMRYGVPPNESMGIRLD